MHRIEPEQFAGGTDFRANRDKCFVDLYSLVRAQRKFVERGGNPAAHRVAQHLDILSCRREDPTRQLVQRRAVTGDAAAKGKGLSGNQHGDPVITN